MNTMSRGTPFGRSISPLQQVVVAVAMAAAVAALLSSAWPARAAAATGYVVDAHFVEPIAPSLREDCAVADGFCGSGRLTPFGRATEMIDFGAACGGACDLRTIIVSSGTLVLHETFSNFACPGSCRPNPASPVSGTLTDVVAGGTGAFAGASGVLVGQVRAAGDSIPAGESQVNLSGSVTVAG
jgi:hypothetical protein